MRARGFTLIELLVALAIFAVLSGLAYTGLVAVVNARERLDAEAKRLGALQLAVTLLERDVRQAIPRPVRDRFGEVRPSLVGARNTLELTTILPTSAAVRAQPAPTRVGWSVADGHLARVPWPVLDRTPATQPAPRELLDHVERLELRYLDRTNHWAEAWPPPRAEGDTLESLPRAIELKLVLSAGGTITRLVELPAPVAPRAAGGR